MRVLALDTTTRAGSVALVDDDRVIDERGGDAARTHARAAARRDAARSPAANQTPLADVDLFAVASGPGSFTGLRIGIATMQGLAFVHGRRMVGVSALEALAHCASVGLSPGALVGGVDGRASPRRLRALYRVTDAPAVRRRIVSSSSIRRRVGSPRRRWREVVERVRRAVP